MSMVPASLLWLSDVYPIHSLMYRIRSIRRRGYYLFHRTIYLRVAFIINPQTNNHTWYLWGGRSRPFRRYRRRWRRISGELTSFRRLLRSLRMPLLSACLLYDATHEVCPCACTYNLNTSRGCYSRAAVISFRASGGAASIWERWLIKSGIWSSEYGMYSNYNLVKLPS